ncbi:NYN domain-containing protein [Nocardioidaceae bacterium SCSIO 66511]|nr:NYN domain-containing protein [Nocardioidaceae bacterium SCSIO 66511]
MAADPTPTDGQAIVLPDSVRHRVVALTSDALSSLEARQVPASLRKVARFTPARRARLAATAIATAVATDDGFRERVAGQVRRGNAAVADAIEADAVEATDPVEVAAIAYLTRVDGWQRALDAALETIEADREASAASAVEESGQAERLARQVEQSREELRSARAAHRKELDSVKADNADLRRKLGDARTRARTAEADRDRLEAELDEVKDHERTRANENDAEVRRLRQRLEAAVAEAGDLRRQARGDRAQGSMRSRLLLDTVIDAAQGLRRELALPPLDALPADLVGDPAGDDESASAHAHATVTDAQRLRSLLELPRAHVIVDGYNVSKSAWGETPLERQRSRLVTELGGLAARTAVEVTVVFDGADVAAARPAARGVRVRFSPSGVTADDVIAQLVSAEPEGRPVIVVSSDAEVAAHARRVGGRPAVSAALVELLSGR